MQGDILWPTDNLKNLLREVHPHFCDPKYIAFIIITQSCDLLPRDSKPCKADYINLSVVRDMESCLSQFLDNVCKKVASGVYLERSKMEASQLLSRVLNQNEQALGLFYLHPDTDTVGISEYAVALLRVSVALRAHEHYQLLQDARKGRLAIGFREKLGWLVGNLYSRIGTPDWHDQPNGDEIMKGIISQLIDSDMYFWINKALVNAAKEAGVQIDKIPREDMMTKLKDYQPLPFKEQIAEAAKEEASAIISRLPEELLQDIDSTLPFKDKIKEIIKTELRQVMINRFNEIPKKIRNRLINNSIVSKAVSREELD
jgi:hypothetical protein